MSKYIIIGLGSIGQRHWRNLMALRPEAHVILADPFCRFPAGADSRLFYRDWALALQHHQDVDGVIIASPTSEHLEQLTACVGVPVFVEKPPCEAGESLALARLMTYSTNRVAVGFQYRYHHAIERARNWRALWFRARDRLIERYGCAVGEAMAAHPIDTAIRLLGKSTQTDLVSDGARLTGSITHKRGLSRHDYDISSGPRESTIAHGAEVIDLYPDDGMYLRCLAAWLAWAEGGEFDPRLATLGDGLAVVKVLEQVKEA